MVTCVRCCSLDLIRIVTSDDLWFIRKEWMTGADAGAEQSVAIVGMHLFKSLEGGTEGLGEAAFDDTIVESKRTVIEPCLEPWRKIVSRGGAAGEAIGYIHLLLNSLEWWDIQAK